MNYLLRRRSLGKTSCEAISGMSAEGLEVVRNDSRLPERDVDWVFRWGCTSNVPAGRIVNEARGIHLVSQDKAEFRRHIGELAPEVWQQAREVRYPAVIRPIVHHQGRHLYVVNNQGELAAAIARCEAKAGGWYGAPLIDKTNEYRVFVVQGRVVCVAEKFPPEGRREQVAWNHYQGGRFENVKWGEWPLKTVRIAVECFEKSGLDFGGVDIMVDREGRPWVLEMNAAPSLTSQYRQECMAKAFDWIIRNDSKDPIPRSREKGGWRKFIHPAISNEAILA